MYDESTLVKERFQLLDENGHFDDSKGYDFDDELLVKMYKWMVKMRSFDVRLLKMQRQGRIGTYAPFSGQEAAQIGSALALDLKDWIFPSYREIAACVTHGLPMKQVLLYVKGHFEGGKVPKELNIFPIQIIIAAQALHATGCAWASKLKGEKQVSVSYFGDGATSEGDFHEALNFASVHKVPTIFFCQNNQWAISVPLKKQTVSSTIAQKAIAYGMKGVQVDGNDGLAVYQVMKEAVARARNGEGPTLIEAVTYRQGPHTTADDPTKYREKKEVENWINVKDPITRFRQFLEKKNLWTGSQEEALQKTCNEEIDQAIREAEVEPLIPTYVAFDYVYAEGNTLLQEQKEEVQRNGQRREDV